MGILILSILLILSKTLFDPVKNFSCLCVRHRAMSPPILKMENIQKRFGATRALKGVSLEVRAGEVLALIGENGAGKSTLMKVLSGAHPPDVGRMELGGQP